MKTIAKNANDFESIRTMNRGNCIYVDKTDFFHRLVTAPGENLFFIARPLRFGKSLMITTFKYIFEGRRELFKGLKIDQTDYDWKVHPVIHRFPDAPARRCDVGGVERVTPLLRRRGHGRVVTRYLQSFSFQRRMAFCAGT